MLAPGRRALLFLVIVGSLAARAEASDITVYVGGVIPGELTRDGVEIPLDNGPMVGFRLRTDFVPHFGMEHTLGFSSDYLFPSASPVVKDAKGFVFNSNLIFDLPSGKLVPYLTAGIGIIHPLRFEI
jgi:hypothetical protein